MSRTRQIDLKLFLLGLCNTQRNAQQWKWARFSSLVWILLWGLQRVRKIQERAKISQRAETKRMATCLSWAKPSEQPLHFIWRGKRTLYSLLFSRATLAWSHDSSPLTQMGSLLAGCLGWIMKLKFYLTLSSVVELRKKKRNMRFAYSILSQYFKNFTWRLKNKIKL